MRGKKWYQLWPRPDFFPAGAWLIFVPIFLSAVCIFLLIEVVVPALWPVR
ncbi:MAG TPA: hypothetical protein VLD63_06830 [Anaerolineales bacterium]|nr:hypothetical protein [Anaerolineales bacterium]